MLHHMIQHKKTIIIGANATAERRFFTVVWPQDRLFIVEKCICICVFELRLSIINVEMRVAEIAL